MKLAGSYILMLIGLVGVIETVGAFLYAPWWIIILFAISFTIFTFGLSWYIDDAVEERINKLEKRVKYLENK